jgi:hypothetical protein
MEWNRVEWSIGKARVERKGREHTRKCYRPTGDWAMRVSQQDIVPEISAEQVDQANRSWDSQSHMRSLVSCSVALVSYTKEIISKKGKKKESSKRNSVFMTFDLRGHYFVIGESHIYCSYPPAADVAHGVEASLDDSFTS